MWLALFACLLLAGWPQYAQGNADLAQNDPVEQRIVEVFGWKQFDFNYPSEEQRQEAISSGSFIPNSMDPTGVFAAGNRVFICLPRWRRGVPATLAYVEYPSESYSPRLNPYPNWELSKEGNCDGLTSVFRVFIDDCNRLWAIDTGWSPSWLVPNRICPVKVMAFDLATDKVVLQYILPQHVIKSDALPVNIVVDFPKGKCNNPKDAILYIADTVAFSIIVADMSNDEAWRVVDKTVFPTPDLTTFHVGGETFDMIDGVMGMALGPREEDGDRNLFFSAMGSYDQRWVKTSVLRNKEKSNTSPGAFKSGISPRGSQTAGYAMDKNGVLFFGLLNSDSLVCWNSKNQYEHNYFGHLAQDKTAMQFLATVSIDSSDRIWAVSTRNQKFVLDTIDPNDINFRVFMSPSVEVAIEGTICKGSN